MSFKKFCPKCGKETQIFIGKVCLDCFLKNNKLFELGKINITKCKHCNKLLTKNGWKEFNDELIAQEVANKIKLIPEIKNPKIFVELQKFDEINYEALIQIKGIINDSVIEKELTINFQLKETTCDSCMKLNSNYREAVLQLRAEKKENENAMFELAKNLLNIEKSKDSLSGTSKIQKVVNGYDLQIGSKKAAIKVARHLAKLYNTRIVVSKKLIGEDEQGKRKYRHTFCVRDYKE